MKRYFSIPTTSLNLVARVVLTIAILTNIVALTACMDPAPAATNVNLPSYTDVMNTISEYRTNYFEFLSDSNSEVTYTSSEAETPSGNPCSIVVMQSDDGQYTSATITIPMSEGSFIDEYFMINDDMLYIVRSTVSSAESDGTSFSTPTLVKYVVIGNSLYLLDEQASTISEVSRPDSFDFYLSQSEIISTYGKQEG